MILIKQTYQQATARPFAVVPVAHCAAEGLRSNSGRVPAPQGTGVCCGR